MRRVFKFWSDVNFQQFLEVAGMRLPSNETTVDKYNRTVTHDGPEVDPLVEGIARDFGGSTSVAP
jgi:hypothetical protein